MNTIKEIAELAGVSTATVSNVINNTGRVSKETKKRILEILEATKFQPNLVAKSFRQKTSMTLGVIVEDVISFNIAPIIDGICEYAEEMGYSILLDNLRFNSINPTIGASAEHRRTVEKVSNFLLKKQVDAIIYIGTYIINLTGLIKLDDIPVVYAYSFLDESKASDNEYCVSYDEKKAAYEATKILVDAGHKRIGCITGEIESISVQERLKGYQECLRDSGLLFYPEYVGQGNWSYISGYEKGRAILSSSSLPTAVFSMSDLMAYGFMSAAKDMDIQIPEQISVVGFDDIEYSKYSIPKLTTLTVPLKEIGQKSCEVAINALNSKDIHSRPASFQKLPCKRIYRETVKSIIALS